MGQVPPGRGIRSSKEGGVTRPSPEEAAAIRTERLEGLHGQFVEQVETLTTSEGWKHMLQMAAKMHRYSFQNTLLILGQRENATQVAGYRAWQKLGRQVIKGAQAIWVLGPVTYKTEPQNEATGETQALYKLRASSRSRSLILQTPPGRNFPSLLTSPARLQGSFGTV